MARARPHHSVGFTELATLANAARRSGDLDTLDDIAYELSFRETTRATELHSKIEAHLRREALPLGARAQPTPEGADPDCPDCGAPMARRTARRGPNAGNQFWGCTEFPECRGIRNLTPTEADGDAASAPPDHTPDATSPTPFVAAPSRAGDQVEVFESIALPASLVAAINLRDAEPLAVRAFAGWRLDFPRPARDRPTGTDLTLVTLARDLLLRGTTPLAFSEIEQAIQGRHGVNWEELSGEAIEQLLLDSAAHPPAPHRPQRFDSPEEAELAEAMVGLIEARRSGWSIQSQVHVKSLSHRMPEESRCDFLLVHPEGRRVVVELDGAQHSAHADADTINAADLRRAGYEVLRITTDAFRSRSGLTLDILTQLLAIEMPDRASPAARAALRDYRVIHQIQIGVVQAILSGHLPLRDAWDVRIRTPRALPQNLVETALTLVTELLERLSRLWTVEPALQPGPAVRHVDVEHTQSGVFEVICSASEARYAISDVILPTRPLQTPAWGMAMRARSEVQVADGEWFLRWMYRKDAFWEGQWECIGRALHGEDTLVLLPTGRGKSIAFQLAALLRPGPCLVVDPIVSLMDDQIDNLKTVGLDRTVGISGRQTFGDREHLLDAFAAGHYKFCFVSPERFQSIPFRETLRRLTVNTPVALIAIDEAHCVSEWGHDFRTAYLNLGRITREYCTTAGEAPPPLIGLTGTASRVVLKDVQRALGIPGVDAIITPESFDRPELTFGVVTCRSDEKTSRLLGIIEGMPRRFGLTPGAFFATGPEKGEAGLVFCPHVNGSFGTFQVAKEIADKIPIKVDTYSGSAPRGAGGDWEQHKIRVARNFKRDRVNLLACTKAFGMGIDKPNIRFTVHHGLPQTVEAFYQEAGRAGRDQNPAHCEVVLSVDHPDRARKLLDPNTPIDQVGRLVDDIRWEDADDVTRALYFHTRAFSGTKEDLDAVGRVLERLGEIHPGRSATFSWSGFHDQPSRGQEERQSAEKALHHLVTLGVVRDYTLDWARREFQVVLGTSDVESVSAALGVYGRAYQVRRGVRLQRTFEERTPRDERGRILHAADLLLEFVYDTVELARRRGLSEMLEAASEAAQSRVGSAQLKERILLYLTQTDWDVRLESISSAGGLESEGLRLILEEVVSARHAEELRGATVRQLESYPDQPSFLFLRAFAEACTPSPNWDEIRENVQAALDFGRTRYDASDDALATAVTDLCAALQARGKDARPFVRAAAESSPTGRRLLRELCTTLAPDLGAELIPYLLTGLKRAAVA